jgi:hypothetical protein
MVNGGCEGSNTYSEGKGKEIFDVARQPEKSCSLRQEILWLVALNRTNHPNFSIAIHNLDLGYLVLLFLQNHSVLFASIQGTCGPISDLLRKHITSMYISPKIDHVAQVQRPVNNQISMAFDFSTPLLIIVNLMGVERERRISEKRHRCLDEIADMFTFW